MSRASGKFQATFTLTLGDQAENHVGMQKIGSLADRGFDAADLTRARTFFEARGCACELIDLRAQLQRECGANAALAALVAKVGDAQVLVARGGIRALVPVQTEQSEASSAAAAASSAADDATAADAMFAEQDALEKDTKVRMYGRVVNKHARHNLCFSEEAHEPDYEEGKGRIVAFSQVPHLAAARAALESPECLGEAAHNLAVEGNYYFDLTSCGIGWHGDAERRKVVAIRLGETMSMKWCWFHECMPISTPVSLQLAHGDVYVMSEKAVGHDWRSKSQVTLRHSAGAAKFTSLAGFKLGDPSKQHKAATKPYIRQSSPWPKPL